MVYFPWWLSQDQNRPPGTVQRELIKAETGYTDEQLGPGTPLVRPPPPPLSLSESVTDT